MALERRGILMNGESRVYAPIIIITCNRYKHFCACIESLQKNTLAEKTEVFIGLDYPPSPEYEEGYKKISDYLSVGISGFKKVNILKREYNYGVSGNWNDLARRATEQCDRYIGTEDDNVFQSDFLEYINYYLELYKNDSRVFSICGHTLPEEEVFFEEKGYYTFARHGYNGYGIGMWEKKWQEFTNIISPQWIEKQIRKTSYRNLLKIQRRIRYKLIGRILRDDWTQADSLITNYMWFADKFQICPCKTKVKNNGWDGQGIHCANFPEKNEGTFDDSIGDFEIENADNVFHKVDKNYYSTVSEINFNIRYEIIWCLMHMLGFEKTKRILILLKFR